MRVSCGFIPPFIMQTEASLTERWKTMMRKHVVVLLMMCGILIALIVPAAAQDTTLMPVDSVDITGQNADTTWLRVNFSGQEGWVSASIVDVTGAVEGAPVVEAGAGA